MLQPHICLIVPNEIAAFARKYFDPSSGIYGFWQKVTVVEVTRDLALLPAMQSYGSFYAEAYTLRREASTMQSNMLAWLQTRSADHLQSLAQHDQMAGRPLRIVSIGCGGGEVDLAFIKGLSDSYHRWGYTGIDFVGLEPNLQFRSEFMERIKHLQNEENMLPSFTFKL